MKCDFCGYEFNQSESKSGCNGCPMNKACKKMKCPHCNYEMLPVPEMKWLSRIKKWGNPLWKR